MPWTRFIPELDSPAFRWPLPPPDARAADLYQPAAEEAAANMERRFGNLVQALFLKDRLQADRSKLEPLLVDMKSAEALLTLDYFLKRVCPPRRREPPSVPAGQPAAWRRWADGLQDRLRRYLREAFAPTLLEYCVARYIPEEWVPRERVAAEIARTIERSQAFEQVAVALDLKLPAPGGRDWLAMESAAAWQTMQSALAANRPCVANLIWERQDGSWQVETAIAFAYATDAAGEVTLEVCSPSSLRRTVRLDCLRRGESAPASEAALVGIRSVAYQRSLPPMNVWRKFLYAIQVERLLWYLRRLRRRPRR